MDKFNLDVSLVARVGGHSAPRTYPDPHLCFDSDGEEDCSSSDRVMEHPTPHTRAVARGLYQGRCCVVSLCSVSPMVIHTTVFGRASIIHTTVFGRASMFFLEL